MKARKPLTNDLEEKLTPSGLHIIPPLKWMTLSGNKLKKCAIKNPRYARITNVQVNGRKNAKKPNESVNKLVKAKSLRLISLSISSLKSDYNGELNKLLTRSHYLRQFSNKCQLNDLNSYTTIKRQLVRQKNLTNLVLNCNWISWTSHRRSVNYHIEATELADLINKAGQKLKRLEVADIIHPGFGEVFNPSYLPVLRTFLFASLSSDIYNYQPEYNVRTHGALLEKLMSIPTLRGINIRAINNFTDLEFFTFIRECLDQRKEPLLIDVGCGIFGYYEESDGDYAEKYEADLKKIFKGLGEGKVFKFGSSWSVFKIVGRTRSKEESDGKEIEEEDEEEDEKEEDEEEGEDEEDGDEY